MDRMERFMMAPSGAWQDFDARSAHQPTRWSSAVAARPAFPAEPGLQEFLADLGGGLRIAVIGVQLDHQPIVIPDFTDSGQDFVKVEVTLAERLEREWCRGEIFEMDVCDAIRMCPDQRRWVTAAGSQVGGVGAEGDATTGEDPLDLIRALGDRAKVRVIAGRESMLLGNVHHAVKSCTKERVVLVGGAGRASCPAADH